MLSFLFLMEMMLKVVALGLHGYMRDRFNIFDGFVVIISMIEVNLHLRLLTAVS